MRNNRTLRKRVTESSLTKTLFRLFFVFVGLSMLSTTCNKVIEDPDPDTELGEEAHKFDPEAENVSVEWLGETIFCQEIDGRLVFQGDIIIIPDQDNTKGAGHAGVRLWDEGKVYYYIDDNKFLYKEDVEAAMEHISSYTYIKFVELKTAEAREYRNKSYIKFITIPGKSWSYLGMLPTNKIKADAQELSIGWPGIGTVIHELGHALGLIHEHSRPDRDIDIMIDIANINEKYFDDKGWIAIEVYKNVFALMPMGEHSTSLDYGSIMMYHPSAGCAKPIFFEGKFIGYEEVLKKDNGTSYKDEYQREHLSPLDIDVINAMYPQKRVSPDIIISEANSKFINDDTYKAAGEVIFEGYFPAISEKGFYYGKVNDDLTKVIVPGTSRGSYHFDLEDLEADTVYIVKAYVVQDNEEFLSGKAITFNTPINADTTNTFTDPRDENTYKWVTIGNQTWMAENLKYLPSVVGPETGSFETPYYYVYGYDGTSVSAAKATDNYKVYGVLYNWPAAIAACPTGWHLPSDNEWTQLIDYLGGEEIAGGKLKEAGTTHWAPPNEGATNETGFTALPGGWRVGGSQVQNRFILIGETCDLWCATSTYTNFAIVYVIQYMNSKLNKIPEYMDDGFSVRCVKD